MECSVLSFFRAESKVSDTGSAQFWASCLLFVYIYIIVRFSYQERRVEIPLSSLTLLHFCACPKPGSGFLMSCHGLFCVQWFEVKVDCLFCWYLWNCWWSLFKLSFHNLYKFVCNCSTGEQLGALVCHYGTIIFSLCSFVTDNMKTILRYLYNCVNSVYLFIYRYLFYPNTKLLF